MTRKILALCALLTTLAVPALAQDRVTLGFGRLFINDALGDTEDRWRTGAYTISRIRGQSWGGTLPGTPGEILELRLRAETIAPANLTTPTEGDRRYVGALSFGMHTHFDWQGWETSLGADLVITGPQTGIGRFQRAVHDLFGLPIPGVLDDQIGNGFHPTAVAEIGRSFDLGGRTTVRPFAEARVGVETMLRVGGDLTFGGYGQGALMLRDPTTGHRYRAVEGTRTPGLTVLLGADVAHVLDSVYLPEGGEVTLSDSRSRLRAGVHWQGDRAQVFYGLTWLGKEFEEQPEGQFVGALNVSLRF